jgi:alpha-galactosidase
MKKIFRTVSCLVFSAAILCVVISRSPQADAQAAAAPQESSLTPTPPMGWASWNHYFCDYDENTIRRQADALVSTGMRDAGYKYVVIQECIARERDAQSDLVVDSARFPSGMPALTAYIHKLGLKAGIYTDVGPHTCYPNPRYQGSYDHEQEDARTFASWGMDFVEMDYCNKDPHHTGREIYERMASAIHKSGRPMLFYICSWGNEQPWEWAQGKAQMWRTDYDVSLEKNHVEWSRMVRNFESNASHSVFTAPESWNDADMLEVGNPGLNDSEAQAQFSMWAISASPLLAGADLEHMSPKSKEIYLNKEAIDINQDPLGAGIENVSTDATGHEVWVKSLQSRASGEKAVLFLNTGESAATMNVTWDQLHLAPQADVRDVWTHHDLGRFETHFETKVAPHSATLLLVRGKRSWKEGVIYEAEWPGNVRSGMTQLLSCGECSRGYALILGGDGHQGAVQLRHINIAEAGKYTLRIQYTRNGVEDKQIDLRVNADEPLKVLAQMRSWNWMDVPVHLIAGDNTVSVSYTGALGFDLDQVQIEHDSQETKGIR